MESPLDIMNEIQISSRQKLYVFDTSQELISYATRHFIQNASRAIAVKGTFCVALSGGSTPKAYLEALSASAKAKALDWSKIYIFWSDERAVPPDHPDSNYGMAMQFLSSAPFSHAHFFRMENAEEYEQLIKQYCPDAIFDIIYLGIGEDGHTASLFPGSEALLVQDKLVVSTFVQAKNSHRITFTFPLINRAKQIVVLVTGSAKAPILKEVLSQHAYPASRVGTDSAPALFFSDRAAAALCIS